MRLERWLGSSAPLLLAGAAGAQQSVLFEVQGDSPGDLLGTVVAGLDDVDSDGVPDFAVGSPGDSLRHVRIYSGATGAFLLSIAGPTPGDGFGSSIAATGDVDGDLVGELAIAAPAGGTVGLHSPVTGAALWTWSGAVSQVAHAADAAGDGVADVLLGNPFWPSFAYPSAVAGRVDLYSGATGQLVRSHVGQGTIAIWIGWGVAFLGDVDLDGRADYAAGWPWDMPLADPGQAVVWSGASGQQIVLLAQSFGSWGLGAGVFAPGDVTGDGKPDLGVVDQHSGSKSLLAYASSSWTPVHSLLVPSSFNLSNDPDLLILSVLEDLQATPIRSCSSGRRRPRRRGRRSS